MKLFLVLATTVLAFSAQAQMDSHQRGGGRGPGAGSPPSAPGRGGDHRGDHRGPGSDNRGGWDRGGGRDHGGWDRGGHRGPPPRRGGGWGPGPGRPMPPPPPPQRPRPATILVCQSGDHRLEFCSVNGRIMDVRVNRQLSFASCVPNQTFGIDSSLTRMWVSGGCRAEFIIYTY